MIMTIISLARRLLLHAFHNCSFALLPHLTILRPLNFCLCITMWPKTLRIAVCSAVQTQLYAVLIATSTQCNAFLNTMARRCVSWAVPCTLGRWITKTSQYGKPYRLSPEQHISCDSEKKWIELKKIGALTKTGGKFSQPKYFTC
jgi:hypothetical protein